MRLEVVAFVTGDVKSTKKSLEKLGNFTKVNVFEVDEKNSIPRILNGFISELEDVTHLLYLDLTKAKLREQVLKEYIKRSETNLGSHTVLKHLLCFSTSTYNKTYKVLNNSRAYTKGFCDIYGVFKYETNCVEFGYYSLNGAILNVEELRKLISDKSECIFKEDDEKRVWEYEFIFRNLRVDDTMFFVNSLDVIEYNDESLDSVLTEYEFEEAVHSTVHSNKGEKGIGKLK